MEGRGEEDLEGLAEVDPAEAHEGRLRVLEPQGEMNLGGQRGSSQTHLHKRSQPLARGERAAGLVGAIPGIGQSRDSGCVQGRPEARIWYEGTTYSPGGCEASPQGAKAGVQVEV